jgi:hypothetical protein
MLVESGVLAAVIRKLVIRRDHESIPYTSRPNIETHLLKTSNRLVSEAEVPLHSSLGAMLSHHMHHQFNSTLSRYSLQLSNTVVAETGGSTPIKIKFPSLETILNQLQSRHFPFSLSSSTSSLSIFSKNFLHVITIVIAEVKVPTQPIFIPVIEEEADHSDRAV